MNILVTGGAGYIGSHCVCLLKKKNQNIIVLDNLCNGHRQAVKDIKIIEGDIADEKLLKTILLDEKIDVVYHFAALSNVGESVKFPEKYACENVEKMAILLDAMGKCRVPYIVFSSSAAIFGEPKYLPIDENHPRMPLNPYGTTKMEGERLLKEADKKYGIKFCSLRYFNAAGANVEDGIGESHNPEYHLLPLIFQTALKKRESLLIYGNNYNTKDGTCIRDYIHVNDLSEAHYKAMLYLIKHNQSQEFNLGSNYGYSVLEVIQTFETLSGINVNYKIAERREGDPACLIASYDKAEKILDWQPTRSDLENIIKDAWHWEKNKKF